MKTTETHSAEQNAPAVAEATRGIHPNGQPGVSPPERRMSFLGKFLLILVLAGAGGGAYRAYSVGLVRVRQDVDRSFSYVRQHMPETTATEPTAVAKPRVARSRPAWDGFVTITREEANQLGLVVVPVERQDKPIKLELPGRTDYDPNTLSKIRPRFDTLVERVHAELGQKVRKGDPLVDLFSTELAAAKNDYQLAYVQWQHDLTLRNLKEDLIKTDAIARQNLVDARNDENKSRLAFTTAKQKLKVFEVPDDQINRLIRNLDPAKVPTMADMGDVADKARMTRLSPVDGVVISRDVVAGNLYDNNDVLMVIAPLEHLFVWVNVYEADQIKVKIGQEMEIRFPYLDETVLGEVQYVAPEVDKVTRAIKIRATVPNVDAKLKSDMLVRASLEIPPVSTNTVIPRSAMVVMNGAEYAFVDAAKTEPIDGGALISLFALAGPEGALFGAMADTYALANSKSQGDVAKFERRKLEIAEEREDHVVVARGLDTGDRVAAYGSLILAQLYEDQQMVVTGLPVR
jgi:cobalt-zinc-cadmium efflux system membrane fusion protein